MAIAEGEEGTEKNPLPVRGTGRGLGQIDQGSGGRSYSSSLWAPNGNRRSCLRPSLISNSSPGLSPSMAV
jgi:hypothetical protein